MKHISHTANFDNGTRMLQEVYFANPLIYIPKIVDKIRTYGQVIEYSKKNIEENDEIKISFKNGGDLSVGDLGGGNVLPARYLFKSKKSFQPQMFTSQADSNVDEAMEDVGLHLSDLNKLYESQSLAGLGALDITPIESVNVGSSAQDVGNFFSYAQDKISETVDGDVQGDKFLHLAIGVSQLFQMKSPELNDNSAINNKLLLSKLIKEKADASDYNYMIVHVPSIVMATTGWAEFEDHGEQKNGFNKHTRKIVYALGNQKFFIRSLDAVPVKRYKITFVAPSAQLYSLQGNRSSELSNTYEKNEEFSKNSQDNKKPGNNYKDNKKPGNNYKDNKKPGNAPELSDSNIEGIENEDTGTRENK